MRIAMNLNDAHIFSVAWRKRARALFGEPQCVGVWGGLWPTNVVKCEIVWIVECFDLHINQLFRRNRFVSGVGGARCLCAMSQTPGARNKFAKRTEIM